MFQSLVCLVLSAFLALGTYVSAAHAASATLYKDSNYSGGTLEVTEDVSCFVDVDFNDVLSSARVHDGTLTLFSDCDYGQPSITITEDGGFESAGNYPSSDWLGGRNDYFSSIKVN